MSLDKSLKKASGMGRARNVLNRAERLALLQEDDKWTPAAGVYNIPKTKFDVSPRDNRVRSGRA